MDPRSTESDTITITEHHVQEMKSCGADILCSAETAFSKGVLPARVAAIRESMAAEGLPPEIVSIDEITRSHEYFGGAVGLAILGSIIALIAGTSRGVGFDLLCVGIAAANVALLIPAWYLTCTTLCQFRITAESNDMVERIHQHLKDKHPQTAVLSTSWRFHLESEVLGDWIEACIARANKRAERAARALGVEIVGILSYEEKHELPERYFTPSEDELSVVACSSVGGRVGSGVMATPNVSRVRQSSIGYGGGAYANRSRAGAHVVVRYRVANYQRANAVLPPPAKAAA
ncbi:MAG: hypothetical protein KIS92_00765 [Planctomycetota bacterium]|nr:hypothetical protein [Planctomycetota bacterium]